MEENGKPQQYSFMLQEYEIKLIREALVLYRERFNGPWYQGSDGQYRYAPTPGTRRIDFIVRHLAREALRYGLTLTEHPWPQGYPK